MCDDERADVVATSIDMALTRQLEVVHLAPSLAQRHHDLVRLSDGHIGVQLTVHHEQRSCDRVHLVHR